MTEDEIRELILRRRRQTIVARICYYCFDANIMPDAEYDKRERELKKLVSEYPKIAAKVKYHRLCPSWTVGSSVIKEYPVELVGVARGLLKYMEEN